MTTTTASGSAFSESGKEPKVPFPLEDLAQCFDFGRWRSLRWLPRGRNEHAEITTDRSTYYLRRSHTRKARESVQWQVELLIELHRHGLPVPQPLACRKGGHIVELGERFYTATEILPGTPFDDAQPEHVLAMGRMLARFHAAGSVQQLRDPKASGENIDHALREELTDPNAKDHPELWAHAKEVEARLAPLLPHLPVVLLHQGCRRRNMLFTGTRITGLLDFDSARFGPRVLDVVGALLDVSKVHTAIQRTDHKVALDLSNMALLLGGYREIATLSPIEVEAIPVLMTAKRAAKALGSMNKLSRSDADEEARHKILLEQARLVWLIEHADAVRATVEGASTATADAVERTTRVA
ncbi:MAG: phosphotransferase enzyme family protein [Sporichthyaceae bacterium]